jgi:hypothetical protein
MKFPFKDKKNDFKKTIDSNIKYLVFFDFIKNNKNCEILFFKIFNKLEINTDNFSDFDFNISNKNFIEMFNFYEY